MSQEEEKGETTDQIQEGGGGGVYVRNENGRGENGIFV